MRNYIKPNNVILTKKIETKQNIQYTTFLENLQTWNILNSNSSL
jgi:hypothetical protein